MLDAKKVSLLHVARRRLQLTDDDYRAVLRRLGGVESSRDLSDAGFAAVMDHFTALGFRSTSCERNLGIRVGMASPGQVALMRKLWHDYTNGEGDDRSLGKWLERSFGFAALRFVDQGTAPRIITALSAMAARKADFYTGTSPAA